MRAPRRFGALVRAVPSVALTALTVLGFGGCSSTSREPGTGETHFLASCTTSCPDGLSCVCGACTKACSNDAACSAFPGGARCMTSACGAGSACDVACAKDADCADVPSAPHCAAGTCRASTVHPADAGDDFASCARRPPSVCTREETCAQLGCGGLEFQSDGCMRMPCSDDSVCGADERCVSLLCTNTSTCSYNSDSTCSCGGPTICLAGGACNPVTVVGKKGDLTSIAVLSGGGPCPPGSICTSTWTITPDGTVTMSKAGVPSTATLDAADLTELLLLVNGPDLRLALENGISCNPPPTDVGISIVLTLSTGELRRDVTGCVISGPSGNVFQQVDTLVTKY